MRTCIWACSSAAIVACKSWCSAVACTIIAMHRTALSLKEECLALPYVMPHTWYCTAHLQRPQLLPAVIDAGMLQVPPQVLARVPASKARGRQKLRCMPNMQAVHMPLQALGSTLMSSVTHNIEAGFSSARGICKALATRNLPSMSGPWCLQSPEDAARVSLQPLLA
jgi:hypothetical protein